MILRRDEPAGTEERARGPRADRAARDNGPLVLAGVPPTGPVAHLVTVASHVAEVMDGRLLLATVVPLPRITPHFAVDSLLAARGERLARIRRDFDRRTPATHVVVVAHGVGSGLLELTRQRNADIAVVGWPRSATRGVWSRSRTSVHGFVKTAPCGVCVVEKLPTRTPDRVLVSVGSGRETELAISVARAMVRGAPGATRRTGAPRGIRSREQSGRARWSGRRRRLRSISVIGRIEVTDPAPGEDDRVVGKRASALGADVLVAGALKEEGVWPLRRKVLRTGLADSFPGPVVLIRPGRRIDGGEGRKDRPR